jgi:hypothetical protein
MKKYKIHKGKKANNITDEQIMKHKNFDKLFISYNDLTKRKKPPIYKSKKWFLYLILIALAAYVISEFN